MSRNDDAFSMFDQPLYNGGSETIPGSAVVEVKSPGFRAFKGRDYFNVGKPSADGKIYLVNSPFPIEAAKTGSGASGFRTPGVHALFNPSLEPTTGLTLAPVADQWYLGDGSGWCVVGDVTGEGASQPGFPPSSSTKRVRVLAMGGSTPAASAPLFLAQVSEGTAGYSAGGIRPAELTSSPNGIRMFKGKGVRYSVRDIEDEDFGEEGDLAEPESETATSITWVREDYSLAKRHPAANVPPDDSFKITLWNWVTVPIQIGDRVVVCEQTTTKGRKRFLIIARDCG